MEGNAFKSTESLFSRIREDLYSFDNSGLLDEGRFYNYVVYIINLLGINWFREAEEILEVSSFKTELPVDFKLLEAAYRCTRASETITPPDGVVMKRRIFDYYPETRDPDTHNYTCPDYYNQPTKCIFNRQEEILVQRGSFIVKYSAPILLKLGNVDTKRCCVTNCANVFSTSSDQITIQNKRIYTNFEDGSIYLMYHAFPLDETTGLPMIPDNPIIEKCIEDYIKYNILKNIITNGDADVSRLIEMYRADHKESLAQAMHETKLPTFKSLVKMIRDNRKSLDIYQL